MADKKKKLTVIEMFERAREDVAEKWTADRNVVMTLAGDIVEYGHEEAAHLLIGEGGQIPLEFAKELGLYTEPEPAPETPGAE